MSIKKDIRDISRINLKIYRIENKITQVALTIKTDLNDKYISDLKEDSLVLV